MHVLIFLAYAFYVLATLCICLWIFALASLFTMDTQDYGKWAIATVCVLGVCALSGYGMWALS